MPLHTARFYLGEPELECILTRLTDAAYPARNHISCFAVLVVLPGRIRVGIGGGTTRRGKGEVFIARLYEPHSVAASGVRSGLFVRAAGVCADAVGRALAEDARRFVFADAGRGRLCRALLRPKPYDPAV